MTPWKHSESSAKKWGGNPTDYIALHDWFDETKAFTGDWTHRALRHHSAGIQWAVERFGHVIRNSNGKLIPTKMLAEQHVEEDCGFVPTPKDWLQAIGENAESWMLKVKTKSIKKLEVI
tara:strand:- start:1159 stop:1515 length:357 start_codon:yes stop_codon:yes gene_type:complete